MKVEVAENSSGEKVNKEQTTTTHQSDLPEKWRTNVGPWQESELETYPHWPFRPVSQLYDGMVFW